MLESNPTLLKEKAFPTGTLKGIVAWAFYDWAMSSYYTIILTFVFSAYFTEAIAKNKILGTAQWGNASAITGLIVALLSPFLGAIADNEGSRKPWIAFFTLLSITSSAMLWFAKPSESYVIWALFWVVLATAAVEISTVFYNSMLENLAPNNYVGRVSGWAWGLGYVGGIISLSIALFGFIKGYFSGLHLDESSAEQIRICGPFVALWFAVFSLPLFFWTPDRKSTGLTHLQAIKKGIHSLVETLQSITQHKEILKFLIARIFFMDGLNTLFAFGGIYAAGTFHMPLSEVIEFGISMNVAAGLGAAIFAWIDDCFGSKRTILCALSIMIVAGIAILFVHSKLTFWILGLIISIGIGPVQASSRSLMVHLAPPELITSMFGLFALSGKLTAFLGPFSLGVATYYFQSQRVGMSTIMFFLLVGGILMCFVRHR